MTVCQLTFLHVTQHSQTSLVLVPTEDMAGIHFVDCKMFHDVMTAVHTNPCGCLLSPTCNLNSLSWAEDYASGRIPINAVCTIIHNPPEYKCVQMSGSPCFTCSFSKKGITTTAWLKTEVLVLLKRKSTRLHLPVCRSRVRLTRS